MQMSIKTNENATTFFVSSTSTSFLTSKFRRQQHYACNKSMQRTVRINKTERLEIDRCSRGKKREACLLFATHKLI